MNEIRPIDAAIRHLQRIYTPGAGRAREDPEPDFSEDSEEAFEDLPHELVWPPPGLEHIHGLLPRVTAELFFAGVLLVAPVALGQLRDRPPELGSWGTVSVLMVVGILLFAAYIRVLVLFNRATSGVRAGYPRQLVWQVAADSWRNTPQLLRGDFSFERLGIAQRTSILNARVAASLFAFAAMLWITITFPLWLLLAANGRINGSAVWIATLLPAGLLVLISILFRWRELRAFFANRLQDEEDRHLAQQARGWRHLYQRAGYTFKSLDTGARYRLAGVAAVFSIFLIFIPVVLAAFTMVIPQLVRSHASMYPLTVRRAAFEPLRAYRLPSDSTIPPLQAGEAFHRLVVAGSNVRSPLLKPAPPADPDSAFHILGRAPAMDYAGSRWNFAGTGSVPPWRIEPAAHRFQQAADAHALRAGTDETALREIIGAGFLVADDALTIWDAQTGQTVIQVGAAALASLLERTGKGEEAGRIRGVLNAAALASKSALTLSQETRATQRGLQLAVVTPHVPRAVRWDLFMGMNTTARCASLPALVFGPGKRHQQFSRYAHGALVRYPADEEYFKLVSEGYAERIGGWCNTRWIRDAFRGYR